MCTLCANGIVFIHSKVEKLFIFGIGGALGITLSMDTVAFELKVFATKLNVLSMEAMFLMSPPLGLDSLVPMDEVVLRASSKIGNPCHDSDCTTF